MRWTGVLTAGALAAALVSAPADADVLCKKKTGAVKIRTACKSKETQVTAADLGLQGPQGEPGAPGAPGTPGPPGPSDALSVFNDAISPPPLAADADVTVATLNLAAGSYALSGHFTFDDISGAPRTIICRLDVDGTPVDSSGQTMEGVGFFQCTNLAVVELAAPGVVTLVIDTPASSVVRGGRAKIVAIKVDTVTNTEVEG